MEKHVSQDAALLVVELDRVLIHPVLDAHALGTVLKAADDLPFEGVPVEAVAQEPHDVQARERLHPMPHQGGIDLGQVLGLAKARSVAYSL